MAEVYAAFLAYDDHNIGRVVDAVTKEGIADNTLIIFIEGDNGGSAEGTLQGTANEIATVGNRSPESFDYLYSIKDELGGPMDYNHMPAPWSWAVKNPAQSGVSDCLSGQAIFHGDLVRTIALRIVRSWRRQAMMATFFGLPRLTRRW